MSRLIKGMMATGVASMALSFATAADAHMVAFGWKETTLGTVLFAEHWHGDLPSAYSDNGGLHITDVATGISTTVQWDGVINNTPEATLALTGIQADPGNCCRAAYSDWMFTTPLALGNGVYDFFTGTACCVDTMSVPVRVTITGISNLPPGIGGVPEPATWAMLILGFGAIGAAMRRSKVRTAVSYA